MMVESKQEKTVGASEKDQIRADRACIGCGFNLYGQTVTKEEHYGLAIARCPECGTVAALQQYPTMSHWVNRFRAIIAGVYIMFLLGSLGLTGLALSGFSAAASDMASEPLAQHLGIEFSIWEQKKQTQANQAQGASSAPVRHSMPQRTSSGSAAWVSLSPVWMDEHLDETIEQFGGLWNNLGREMYLLMVPSGLVALIFGVYWSVVLLGASRWKAMVVPAIAVIVGGIFVIGTNIDYGSFPWAPNVAESIYVPRIVPVVMAYELVFLSIGVLLGRPVSRFLIRLALPPRSLVPFGVLWTRDGLEPPRPSR